MHGLTTKENLNSLFRHKKTVENLVMSSEDVTDHTFLCALCKSAVVAYLTIIASIFQWKGFVVAFSLLYGGKETVKAGRVVSAEYVHRTVRSSQGFSISLGCTQV